MSFSPRLNALMSKLFTGRGSDRIRKSIIEDAFGAQSLWDGIMASTRTQFGAEVLVAKANVTAAAAAFFEGIKTDFDLLRQESVVRESERNPEFRNEVARELQGARQRLGVVHAVSQRS